MFISVLIGLIILAVLFFLYLLFRPRRWDGAIVITQDELGKRTFELVIDKDPDVLQTANFVVFKVIDRTDEDTFAE